MKPLVREGFPKCRIFAVQRIRVTRCCFQKKRFLDHFWSFRADCWKRDLKRGYTKMIIRWIPGMHSTVKLQCFETPPTKGGFLRSIYSLLHLECHSISISNLDWSLPNGTWRKKPKERDVNFDLRLKKWHSKCNRLYEHAVQGGKDSQDALSCRSFSAKEPLIQELFCGKRSIKIRHPMTLHHPVGCLNSRAGEHCKLSAELFWYNVYRTGTRVWHMCFKYIRMRHRICVLSMYGCVCS